MANMLKVAPALVSELEKRVGMQFERATLADLLIPSYNKSEQMYDVDLVQRLLEHLLVQEQTDGMSPSRQSFSDKHSANEGPQRINSQNAKMRVARLVDSYLTEVSWDRNLSLTKFQAHPTLTEHEGKRLCRIMDCQKLSIDACMHAAQNERLPLRVVVRVIFSEQTLLEGTPQSFQKGWAAAKKDINMLKFELESMKAKYLELQSTVENLQQQQDKVSKQKQGSAWTTGWKKLRKLTKMNNLDSPEIGPRGSTVGDKPVVRRWRNSIS
ncbi:hypothetical protein MLD38_035475 [Melastoma candidum]|uniref:Uncharacterized protein n=1 Tax=Melastoma candidum TaxID=119954 RepID=A0ACB9LGQ4_9MYRT|nr:hypothetical protein MLD38_035475 [Melastoma candidum]